MAITPSTLQELNDKSDSSRSGPDGSFDEQRPTKEEHKKVSLGKKSSHDGTKSVVKAKSKTKDEQTAGDKSERSSSPAFDSDDDSSGNGNQQIQLLAPMTAAKRRAPSIAGLLVINKAFVS